MLSAAALALALIPSAVQAAATTIPPTPPVIQVNAAPATSNFIKINYDCNTPELSDPDENGQRQPTGLYVCQHVVTDMAGIFVVPSDVAPCHQEGANTARCTDSGAIGKPAGATGTGEDISVSLGDDRDFFIAANVGDLQVSGGPARDRMSSFNRPIVSVLFDPDAGFIPEEPGPRDIGAVALSGQGGNDELRGHSGPQGLIGGPGKDQFSAGEDNDFVDAKDGRRDGKVKCGPGKDVAVIDKADSVSGCEKVKGV